MDTANLFDDLLSCQLKEVEGVHRFTVGTPKQRVLVLIGTHGKEVLSGIAVWKYLFDNRHLLQDVDLYVAIGNVKAAQLAIDAGGDKEVWTKFRFSPGGTDMNRLPADIDALSASGASYEMRRAEELRTAIGPVDVVLDFHMTDAESVPAGLGIFGDNAAMDDLFRRIPLIESVYTGVCAVQSTQGTRTQPHSAVYGAKLAVEFETGQTGTDSAAANAGMIFDCAGRALGFLAGAPEQPVDKKIYRVVGSVMAPCTAYRVEDEKYLAEHAFAEKGAVLLRNTEEPTLTVVAPCDMQLIWCPSSQDLDPGDVASEVWFGVMPA